MPIAHHTVSPKYKHPYEFVEKIVVHAPDKSSGHRTQQIDIHYNFIGEIGLSHAIDKKETA